MGSLHELDLRLFRRVAETNSRALDATLPRLTSAADHSKLWAGTAALLAVSGSRRGRRAAQRGLLAVAVTSAVVNGPLKWAARRTRPPIDHVPLVRRARRLPLSTSFPSGHSASAAAFATGVALELPAAGVPVGVAAAAVGYSRVYTGVHYPGDVLAGFAIGAGAAVATLRWFHRPPAGGAVGRSAGAAVPAAERGEGVTFVVNPDAGPALSGSPAGRLRELLPDAEVVEVDNPEELDRALRRAAAVRRVIGVGGGDGSVGAAAAIAVEQGRPLAVVPAGTLNHFARDLHVASADDTAAAVAAGEAVHARVGRIAGRVFVNTASFGAYPELVDARERWERRIGKWPAVLVALAHVLGHGQPVRVEIDGREHSVWIAFIGNGRYRPDGLAPSYRDRLDEGLLDVRLVTADHGFARTRLVLAVLTGRLAGCPAYRRLTVPRLSVRSLDGPLRLARDGETFDGPEQFVIEADERELVVFTPRAEASAPSRRRALPALRRRRR